MLAYNKLLNKRKPQQVKDAEQSLKTVTKTNRSKGGYNSYFTAFVDTFQTLIEEYSNNWYRKQQWYLYRRYTTYNFYH